jgi:hypothetical protein
VRGKDDVLHLHRFDDGKPLACTHGLAGPDRDLHQQPRHRREQEAREIGRRLEGHQRAQLGAARRQHANLDPRTVVRHPQRETDALDLGAKRRAVDTAFDSDARERAGERHLARPARDRHGEARAVDVHLGRCLARAAVAAQLDGDELRADLQLVPRQLPGEPRGAREQAALECHGERDQEVVLGMCERGRVEALRELLGDESGREVACREARMAEERGLECKVARDAADDESVQRIAHGRDRRRAVAPQAISLQIIES